MYALTVILIIALFINGIFIAVSALKIFEASRESSAMARSWKDRQNETA